MRCAPVLAVCLASAAALAAPPAGASVGGAGFSERGYAALRRWLQATRATVASCECEHGCPSCVQSPKCGNGNDPLDKAAAVRVLDVVLDELATAPEVPVVEEPEEDLVF